MRVKIDSKTIPELTLKAMYPNPFAICVSRSRMILTSATYLPPTGSSPRSFCTNASKNSLKSSSLAAASRLPTNRLFLTSLPAVQISRRAGKVDLPSAAATLAIPSNVGRTASSRKCRSSKSELLPWAMTWVAASYGFMMGRTLADRSGAG